MPRRPRIPPELTRSPFSIEEGRAAGLTLSALRGKAWRRIGFELYCWTGWREERWGLLAAWKRLLPKGVVFSGRTAAAIHGLDFEPGNPVEVTVVADSPLRTQFGLTVRHCELSTDEVVFVHKMPTTSVERTLRDICVLWPAEEALIAIDMAVHLKLADAVSLWNYTQRSDGQPGARSMRALVTLAEPAESPMETRLRWLLLRAGLPRPQVQTDLCDEQGQFVGRADLYYPGSRLVVEFDGGNHRERLIADDRRQNLLVDAGFSVLRFTSADLKGRPEVVIAQVRAAIAHRSDSARLAQDAPKPASRSARFAQNVRNGDAA
ncbi:MAG TPA: DUF559 domain-containing protein [Candidatus Dormibacteraeota bacterium]|nr:DUF559 domain-containing protein [Candidatus Dormibacteraeota bacterium]